MASENEASCESDPNFAVICGFLEKFGVSCGLTNIDFVDLQEMLENTQEVSQELIELHIKLMRRARRSVSSNDRWERALIKTCHTFSSQDAWEIERFGYKKARISSKLRVLKELLEMQFDYNQKFKNEINKMSAVELRTQPLGRDRIGRAYWYQCDESCQIRVYKDDPDDETWTLVAKNRDGLVSLISQLGNGDTAKSSSEPVSNEDSNSVEVEKPILDTGQSKDSSPKPKVNSENVENDEKMEIEPQPVVENEKDVEESKLEDNNSNLPDTQIEGDESGNEENVKNGVETESNVTNGSDDNVVESKKEDVNKDLSDNRQESSNKEESGEETCENALNLCSKDLSNKDDAQEEKSCLDLSVKAAPCLRIKPITELMAQPQHLDMQKKEFMGIKGKYIRNDSMEKGMLYPNPTHLGKAVQSASYDAICYKRSINEDIYAAPTSLKQPRFDRPTLLGNKKYMSYLNEEDDEDEEDEEMDDEIEGPLMLVQGEGSGFPNESVNEQSGESPIVGDEIEETVLYVTGEGNGEDCETGNKFSERSEDGKMKESDNPDSSGKSRGFPSKNQDSLEGTNEKVVDNSKGDETSIPSVDTSNESPESPESANSPVKQTFFFGNSFSPNTSPMKTASLSFGASTVVDNQSENSPSISPSSPTDLVEGSKNCLEKTDQNLIGNTPSNSTKVPENVDIENIDNNRDISASLSDKISKESECGQQECDNMLINPSDSNASEINKDTVDRGDNLVDSEVKLPITQDKEIDSKLRVSENLPTPTGSPQNKNDERDEESESGSEKSEDQSEAVILKDGNETKRDLTESSNEYSQDVTTSNDQDLQTIEVSKETIQINEQVSSTLTEEESTTLDETNALVTSSSVETETPTVKNDATNAISNVCIQDRQVTGADEFETIDSSEDESNFNEILDNSVSANDDEDIPSSTTDDKEVAAKDSESKDEVDCNKGDDPESTPSEMKESERSIEAIQTESCVSNKNELSMLEEERNKNTCKSECIIDASNTNPKENPTESVEEIDKDDVDDNRMKENNDLLLEKGNNEVDHDDSTKNNLEVEIDEIDDHTRMEVDDSNLDDDDLKGAESSDDDQEDTPKQTLTETIDDDCEIAEEARIETNSTKIVEADDSGNSPSTLEEKSIENEVTKVEKDVEEIVRQETQPTEVDKEEVDAVTSKNIAVKSTTIAQLISKESEGEIIENPKEKQIDTKQFDEEKVNDLTEEPCNKEIENVLIDNDEDQQLEIKWEDAEIQEKKANEKQVQNNLKDNLPSNVAKEKEETKTDIDTPQQENELPSTINQTHKTISSDEKLETGEIGEKETVKIAVDVDMEEQLSTLPISDKLIDLEEQLNTSSETSQTINKQEQLNTLETHKVKDKEEELSTSSEKNNKVTDVEEQLNTPSEMNNKDADITIPSSGIDKDSPVIIVETDEDTSDNRCGIDALKAIKITNVQAKCEILDKIDDTSSNTNKKPKEKAENVDDKKRNDSKEKVTEPQPLRFLRGRRPTQMLSVKSYATRNKNLVLRKETKPPPEINDENKTKEKEVVIKKEQPLLCVVKVERNVENNVRRSTRRKPGDSQEKLPETHSESVSVDVKKIKGRSRKTAQAPQETKQTEEGDLRYSKRLRLSNNQAPSSIKVETIDLTSDSDGKKISVKNCNEIVPLKKEMTIQPTYEKDKDEKKSSKKNGPFLTCVNIQKLKENPVDHVESPLSVESSGGGDNSDVVIIEDDPLAVPEPYEPTSVKTMTLNSFQLDYPSPPPMVMTRSLRKRCRPEPEIPTPTGGKRRKTKGKRQVDLELRRSIEEQKQQEVSSSDDDKRQTSPKRKSQQYKKKQEVTNNVEPPVVVEPVKKPRAPRRKTLLGLDVPAVIEELATDMGNVRHSRRIAQLKIKEEAERRKLEEITMIEPKGTKKKGKKNIDKDYKAEKRKRTKPPTEEEVTVDVPEVEEKKTKRKRKRKHKDPRKIFDEANPWRSSSGSSSSNDEVEEEEEEIVEYSDAESPLFKSDHEFSPESDIEDTEEPQPMKRARTARKEDDVEDDVDDHACQRCGKSDHPEWILLCDSCDNGWHCSCLRPALFIIPEGDWFCPPCQHNSLVKQLEEKLSEYDKKVAKRDIQVRRKERLAYVGISLANVLPVKDTDERKKKKENSEDEDEEDDESRTEDSGSSSESSSSSDSDEPIYQLRQRRQAHSYRFNDYDELINSAIQEEMEAVKGAGNQGRGKDISTIVNAEKEEQAEKDKQQQEEELPPVVPVETKELPPAVVPSEHNDSEEEKIKPVKKFFGRKKQRKLNSLDVSSGDDPDSDEDFKGSSSDEEDDDDFEEDMGSDSSEVYGGRRRKGMAVRRSTRARTSRYDKDFINDDSDDEEEKDIPRKKKSRSTWNESETEESDTSWKWSSRRKSTRNTTSRKKRSKKSKKRFDDSDEDRSKKKKRRIKYGGLNDDEEEEETAGRRTRGKKINYADVLASDSDDEVKRKAPPRIESDDDYVANEDQDQDDDEEFEKEENMEKEEDTIVKEKEPTQTPTPESNSKPEVETSPAEDAPVSELSERPVQNDPAPATPPENFDLDNLNSSIDDLPDDIADDNDDEDAELNPIEEINKNLEEMDEAEMEKLMEEEEYANKQLQLVAMQLEKQKKRKQKEAKKNETTGEADPNVPKKRGRKSKPRAATPASNVVQIATLQVGPDMQSNPELSEPPGVTIPIFSEIPPTATVEGSPKKRRGRGKGKKTLEKEAAAAAAAAAGVNSNPPTTPSDVIPEVGEEQSHIPTTVDTIANVNSDDMSLANAAAIHGAKLAIAAPPQPFSQTQPTPSVITRMLQGQPGQGSYSPMGMGHNYYADQPPSHAGNSPTPPVSNAQMATCVPVSNSMAANHNSGGQLPPMSQPQQQYMHGAPPPRGMSSAAYRQPPPNVNPYHRTSPAPPIPQIRVRNATSAIPPVYHTHHPLDPSPSGGGPINVPTSSMNTPERSSPISIPPSSDSPLSNKSDPTPPPPPYSRPAMRFSNVNTPPMASSPIRQQQNLLPPQHLQQQPSPLRNNMPYHPTNMPSNYYSGYMGGNMGPEETLTPSGYHYSDQFSETNSPQDIGKSYDEENSGEFGGLVSYFSSQREDDLDT